MQCEVVSTDHFGVNGVRSYRTIHEHCSNIVSESESCSYIMSSMMHEDKVYQDLRLDHWKSHPMYVERELNRAYDLARSIDLVVFDPWLKSSLKETMYIYSSRCVWWIESEVPSRVSQVYFGQDVDDSIWSLAYQWGVSVWHPYFKPEEIDSPFVTVDRYGAEAMGGVPVAPAVRLWGRKRGHS